MSFGVKHDTDKLDWTLLLDSCFIDYLQQVVEVLALGQQKYARYNWQGLEKSRVEKAMLRHVLNYMNGEILDPESEKNHLVHVICNCLFLLWMNDPKNRACISVKGSF